MADEHLVDAALRIATALEALVDRIAALVPMQAATQAAPAARSRKPRVKPDGSDAKLSEAELRARLVEQIVERIRTARNAGVSEVIVTETLASGLSAGATLDDAPTPDLFNLSLALQRLTAMNRPDSAEEPAETKQLKEETLDKVRDTVKAIAQAGRLAEATTVLAAHTGAGSVDTLAAEQLTGLLVKLQELTA